VVVKTPQRKWAQGMRVKPATGVEVAKGKIPKGRLIKRDPKLKGKDRPGATPEEIFAPLEKAEAEEKAIKKQAKVEAEAKLAAQSPKPEPNPATDKKIQRDEEWFKNSWEKTFGPGSWDEATADDDW